MKKKILSFALILATTGAIISGCSSQKAASSDSDSTKMRDSSRMSTPATDTIKKDTMKRDTTHH